MPERIQLSRRAGWRLPPNTIVVARGPGRKWGNPHRVGFCPHCGVTHTREEAIAEFRAEASQTEIIARIQTELRGKHLACWCRLDQACHADVLLQLANSPPP